MSNLATFIKEKNAIKRLFGDTLISQPHTEDECLSILVMLSYALEPEVISRDGEASRNEIMQREALCKGAWQEIESILGMSVTNWDVQQWATNNKELKG